jgi:hypothetical protein
MSEQRLSFVHSLFRIEVGLCAGLMSLSRKAEIYSPLFGGEEQ